MGRMRGGWFPPRRGTWRARTRPGTCAQRSRRSPFLQDTPRTAAVKARELRRSLAEVEGPRPEQARQWRRFAFPSGCSDGGREAVDRRAFPREASPARCRRARGDRHGLGRARNASGRVHIRPHALHVAPQKRCVTVLLARFASALERLAKMRCSGSVSVVSEMRHSAARVAGKVACAGRDFQKPAPPWEYSAVRPSRSPAGGESNSAPTSRSPVWHAGCSGAPKSGDLDPPGTWCSRRRRA